MQHLVLDVEDELYTLRERYDYVLIGGDDADAPIAEATAGQMALTLLELVGPEIATRPRHGEVRLSDWVMLTSR